MLHDRTNNIIFLNKVRELEAELEEQRESVHQACQALIGSPPDKRWWFELSVEMRVKRREKLEKELYRFRFYHAMTLGHADDRNRRLEIAKEIPIGELLGAPQKESTARAFFPCPIHQEKTASFVWYKNQNLFHCFGCQARGDSIDLVMKMQGIDFKEALNFLIK